MNDTAVHIPTVSKRPCGPPDVDAYVPARRINALLRDLESLADSWNSLAVTYRLQPGGLWARITNEDLASQAGALESAATQLQAAVQRYREGGVI